MQNRHDRLLFSCVTVALLGVATLTLVASLPLLLWKEWSHSCTKAVLAAAGYGSGERAANLSLDDALNGSNCSDIAWREGKLIVLVCPSKLEEPLYAWGPFEANSVKASYLRMKVTMNQCVESFDKNHQPYYQRVSEVDHPVNSSRFAKPAMAMTQCAGLNPSWPESLPQDVTKTTFSDTADLVSRTSKFKSTMHASQNLSQFVSEREMDRPWPAPKGWHIMYKRGHDWMYEDRWSDDEPPSEWGYKIARPGQLRVRFFMSTMPESLAVIFIGQNNGGNVEEWRAPWTCPGYAQGEIHLAHGSLPNFPASILRGPAGATLHDLQNAGRPNLYRIVSFLSVGLVSAGVIGKSAQDTCQLDRLHPARCPQQVVILLCSSLISVTVVNAVMFASWGLVELPATCLGVLSVAVFMLLALVIAAAGVMFKEMSSTIRELSARQGQACERLLAVEA